MKYCSRCKIEKDLSEFNKDKKKNDGLTVWCRECCIENNRLWREGNRNSIKEYNKKYKEENKKNLSDENKKRRLVDVAFRSKEIERSKKFKENNKDYITTYNRNYFNLRRKEDPIFKLHQTVSFSINKAIKRNGLKKNGSIINYLPYTIEELKRHIESQFEPWMTWNNHGNYNRKIWDDNDSSTWTWQIDHIIPHSTFKYSSMEDEDFKKCWALENLRPYSAKMNFIDGVSRSRH